MSRRRKRHPNPRLVKIHLTYTVEEAARLFGNHRNTVRNWIRDGLSVLDDGRPVLILGAELRAYLERKRDKAKCPCPPGFLYCVRCRAARRPAGGMADYLPVTASSGNLRGICPNCETLMNRRVSIARLTLDCADLDVAFPEASTRIGEGELTSLNCAFDERGKNHENTLS